jgi:hydroxyacylglutathione hydrolase
VIVEQIWTGNIFRNFNYLIACPETGEALAIDPLDHRKCLALARERGWDITTIVNTHHHIDHVGGNRKLVKATGAKLLAHEDATRLIKHVDRGLSGGETLKVGSSVELLVLDTPGHTMSHVCLYSEQSANGEGALFSGDTLFNAGVGNCHHGGDPHALYQTFAGQLARLRVGTLVYPGHDYLRKNLLFTLSVEADNTAAQTLLSAEAGARSHQGFVATLGLEQEVNAFLRLENRAIHERLRDADPTLPANPDPEAVFVRLRQLRTRWSEPWSSRLRALSPCGH